MNYNQLKSYLVTSYNTINGQVDARNWSGANTTLDGVITEVNIFRTQNPTHIKVALDANGNSAAEELVMECEELKKDIVGIQDFLVRNNNATLPSHQEEYNNYIAHLKFRLKLVADRFSA